MSVNSFRPTKGLLAWFASNPVAANLLMLMIFVGGLVSLGSIDKEPFPHFNPNIIEVTAVYPNAGTQEIEVSVCIPIEEAIKDINGIKRMSSEIADGMCVIKISVLPGFETDPLITLVYGRIQSLPRLPKKLDKITVRQAQRNNDDGVIWVSLHGPVEMLALQRFGEKIQADLEQIPGVRSVLNYYELPYELAITVSPVKLLQYRLKIDDISQAVRRSSLDQAGGLLKSSAGELQLRIVDQARSAKQLGEIVLRTQPDGSRLLLKDIATISDGLTERLSEWRNNGEPAQGWEIHTHASAVEVARTVKARIAQIQTRLPEGLSISTWGDDSQAYDERVNALLEDGLAGFILVCLVLTLFLRFQVAVWAGAGILTSILGALWLMPMLDVSLNMLSLFGFLLAMGILVDDAIIIGESVHQQQTMVPTPENATALERQAKGLKASIRGVQAVALPVVLSVSVALVAFLPGLFLPGWAGQMMQPICWVMILTLLFSLIEALLILPAHLATPVNESTPNFVARWRNFLNSGLQKFINRYYRCFLESALRWRYLTLAVFVLLIMLCGAWLASGRIRMALQADVAKDNFWVLLKSPDDMPYQEARNRALQVEQAFFSVRDELDRAQALKLGSNQSSVLVGLETIIWEHGAGFWTELSPEGRTTVNVDKVINAWRKRIGELGRTKIDFLYKEGDVPYDIDFSLTTDDPALLHQAAEQFKTMLGSYPGVFDINDSSEAGKPEIRLVLKSNAVNLGLRLEDLSRQVRQAYFGDEIERFQRGRNEVKIMVRYPLTDRQSLAGLLKLPVQLGDGQYAPLGTLADIEMAPGVSKLIRQDRHRALNVLARVDTQINDVNALYHQLEATEIPRLYQQFPGLQIKVGQERQDQEEMTAALYRNTLFALIVIYVLIAVPFRSYLKPLIFLLAVPVAWCGGIIAHGFVGLPLSLESLVGMIAASGVVVNDSLVLLDYLKEQQETKIPLHQLICDACTARFRPIFLAFLTNFAGFLPTLLETSEQARFLIPMTLSLSAGLLLGMAASLILTPVCYAVLVRK